MNSTTSSTTHGDSLHSELLARLHFGDDGIGGRGGEVRLFADRSAQIVLSPALRGETLAGLRRTDEKALFWGASLTIGLGALGALLHFNHRDKWAWPTFALAGAGGVGCGVMRWQVARLSRDLTARHPLSDLRIHRSNVTGELVYGSRRGSGPGTFGFAWQAHEYDEQEARRFFAALHAFAVDLH